MCLFRRFLAILCLFFALSVCWADDIIIDDNIVSDDIVSGDVDVVVPSDAADEVEITVPFKVSPQFAFLPLDGSVNITVSGTPGSTVRRNLFDFSGNLTNRHDVFILDRGFTLLGSRTAGINIFSQGDASQVCLVVDASAGLPGVFSAFLDYLFFVNLDLRNNLVPALVVMMTAAIGVVFAWWGLRKMYLAILQSWRNGRITL